MIATTLIWVGTVLFVLWLLVAIRTRRYDDAFVSLFFATIGACLVVTGSIVAVW